MKYMAIKQNNEYMDALANQTLESGCKDTYASIIDVDGKEWVSTAEAARILNLSKSRTYQIKNHLTHRKGNSPQSRVYFLKSRLFEDYMNM